MTSSNLLPRCVLACMYPLRQVIYMLTSPTTSSEQFLRASWEAVSQASVLRKPQIKVTSQLSCCLFYFSWQTSEKPQFHHLCNGDNDLTTQTQGCEIINCSYYYCYYYPHMAKNGDLTWWSRVCIPWRQMKKKLLTHNQTPSHCTASLLLTYYLANKTTCRLSVVKLLLYQYLPRISPG